MPNKISATQTAIGNQNIQVAGNQNIVTFVVKGISTAASRRLEKKLNQHLLRLTELHLRLQEWKELHNALQDLQQRLATCYQYIFDLGSHRVDPDKLDRALYEFSGNWLHVLLTLDALRRVTISLRFISSPYVQTDRSGPQEMVLLDRLQLQIGEALAEQDGYAVADLTGEFAKQCNDYLYAVDKGLREDVHQMNQIPLQIELVNPR